MTLPSITNAYLTLVTGAQYSAEYERDASVGSTKFTGSEPVYLSEVIEQVASPPSESLRTHTSLNVRIHRAVIVSDALPVPWAVDDNVTVLRDAVTFTGIVRAVRRTTGFGLDGVVRLLLDDE